MFEDNSYSNVPGKKFLPGTLLFVTRAILSI